MVGFGHSIMQKGSKGNRFGHCIMQKYSIYQVEVCIRRIGLGIALCGNIQFTRLKFV